MSAFSAPHPDAPPRLAVLGAGTVGSALLERLATRDDVEVSAVLVRDLSRKRGLAVDPAVLTDDPGVALAACDIVIELLGGTGLAADLMLRALAAGKPVVTANKAALAERWDEFLPWISAGQVYFEAAVMAGTPAIAALSAVLRGSRPLELHAILNGTCTFILSRLEQGERFEAALSEAQRLGYAEADPSLDIAGYDAAHKLALLARLGFDPHLSWPEVRAATHGITHLTPAIVTEAMEDGGSVALLCSIVPEGGRWRAAVRPVYLPASHALRAVDQSRNGFVFRGAECGEVLIAGPGAGGESTASAVLADLLQLLAGRRGPAPLAEAAAIPENFTPENLGELQLA